MNSRFFSSPIYPVNTGVSNDAERVGSPDEQSDIRDHSDTAPDIAALVRATNFRARNDGSASRPVARQPPHGPPQPPATSMTSLSVAGASGAIGFAAASLLYGIVDLVPAMLSSWLTSRYADQPQAMPSA